MSTIFEIYVDGIFEEAWETKVDAVQRALNIGDELGIGRVGMRQDDFFKLTEW